MRKIGAALAVVALFALVTACGSGASQPAGSTKVSLTEFKFDPGTDSALSVTHGKVVFWLVNSGNTSHDMQIKDSTGNAIATSELVSPGDSKEFDVDLNAGSYTIVCTEQGHEASGMKGTLTVT
jgi:iron uptake system component EfeO